MPPASMPTPGSSRPCLGPEDAIISDALNHASIIDGVRLCKAKRLRYANNDMADLEAKLQEAADCRFRLIATDGVFSMDGIIANLPAICDLAEKYDAMVMVDDSHAIGFVGAGGRGTPEHWGVAERIDIMTGTLGKALGGASGGYTAGKREVVDWLRQRSRPYLFSNTLAPVIAATSLEVLDLLESSGELRQRLTENSLVFFRQGMEDLGIHPDPRRTPHHPGDVRRGPAGRGHGRRPVGGGGLRHRLFLPRGAQGTGAHPHPDVGRPQPGRPGAGPGGLRQGRPPARRDLLGIGGSGR